jgi:NAD(P)-dependent dehydrogenase (short-subunit alcohol dehydrogenase family)
MRGLRDRVVVVAGGASGIGAATAQRLAAEGARVVVGDIAVEKLHQTVESIRTAGGIAVAAEFDSTDEESVRHLGVVAVEEFGGLDGWHNNAADTSPEIVGVDLDSDATTVPMAVWQRSFDVNLTGYLYGVRAAVPLLLDRGGGAMVHTASDGAFQPWPNLSAYNSSKAAILSLSRHVATRWGRDRIRSNVVSPGAILTDKMKESMTPVQLDGLRANSAMDRLGHPDDLAAAVSFLMSDDAGFINGQVLSVNGGAVMR